MEKLKQELIKNKPIAIAFSGGVDSTFLLKVAHDALGDDVVAITARSCFFPEREKTEASEFCAKEGIRQIFIDIDVLENPDIKANPSDRCYHCKKNIFSEMKRVAHENGISYIAEGSNLDDLGDYRPGLRAIDELKIASPLRECGLTKAAIRQFSKGLGLSTWEKPSFACLASRVEYGQELTAESLRMVEQAEQLLLDMGFSQFRVRIHGTIARIEIIPEEFTVIFDEKNRKYIHDKFKALGFSYITLDLMGYRMGSMNETLNK